VFKEGYRVALSRGIHPEWFCRVTVVRHMVQRKGIATVFSILEVHAHDDIVVW
jgi:hypothetical protein